MTQKPLARFSWLLLLAASIPLVAAASATKIMPLGDSITGSPGCWRALLWNRLQNAGYTNVDFVGTLGPQGCAVPYDGDNEGHGGILATNMADQSQLPPWLAATSPDIILMHLGTNDMWSGRSVDTTLAAFTTLVAQMRANNPRVKLLVAQILPMNPSNCSECAQRAVALDAAIPAWAAGLTTAQSPIVVVDQWTGFDDATDTTDGVHPNDSGIQKISDRWYPALVALLSGAPLDTQAPTTPANLSAHDVGSTSLALSWTASADDVAVTTYDIYSGSMLAGSSASTGATIQNLLPGTTYTFSVKARDAAGNASAASKAVTVTTLPSQDVTPPSAPANLIWSSAGGTVTLSWSASTDDGGVIAYDLFFGSFYLGAFGETSVAMMGFKTGTPYTFAVKARDAAGNVSVASNTATVLLAAERDTTPPSAPTRLAAANVTSTSVTLSWAASTDDVGVVVYQVSVGGSVLATTFGTTSAAISGLAPATSYAFTVRALDAANNLSAASAALSVTTLASAGGGGGGGGGGTAVTCAGLPVWNSKVTYNTAGQLIEYRCKLYQNQGYAFGVNPETNNGQYYQWLLIGACGESNCAMSEGPWTTCGPWDHWTAGAYEVYNDVWGSGAGPQCITAWDGSHWTVDSTQPATSGVKSYPNSGFTSLNKKISALSTFTSSFDVSVPSGGDWEAAYDLWVPTEVMVWMYTNGNVGPIAASWDDSGKPIPSATNVTVGGHTWNVYHQSGGSNVISFVRTTNTTQGTVDLKALLAWAMAQGWIPDGTIGAAQFGFEISGTDGVAKDFTTNAFSITAN